eukprot:3819049-Amphidinium_carterae.1
MPNAEVRHVYLLDDVSQSLIDALQPVLKMDLFEAGTTIVQQGMDSQVPQDGACLCHEVEQPLSTLPPFLAKLVALHIAHRAH